MDKQISNILKQNQLIHASLASRQMQSVSGSLVSRKINDLPELISLTELTSLDEQLKLLIDENNKLKEIVKLNKPIEVKEVKASEVKAKEIKAKEVKEDNDSDEDAKEVQPKFSTITNMEDIKRAFFSADY